MNFLNLIESDALVRHFVAHPPEGFAAAMSPEGIPVFNAPFDLLIVADDALRRFVVGLPLYRYWKGILKPKACFVGTTATEYVVLRGDVDPAALVCGFKDRYCAQYPLVIVKDLPLSSPLLDETSNQYSRQFATQLKEAGFVLMQGQALAYVPIDFYSIEDYESRLSSARRKDIRRKLRATQALAIEAIPAGAAQFAREETLREYHELYFNVYRQSTVHFDLLSEDYWRSILQDATGGGVSFEYRHEGRLIGFNLCYHLGDKLIDKYIGFQYPAAREFNLYFVSWYNNLRYALEHRLTHYVAGWTDPQIKSDLGARFTFTQHAVYVRNPLLRPILRRLAHLFESDSAWARASGNASRT